MSFQVNLKGMIHPLEKRIVGQVLRLLQKSDHLGLGHHSELPCQIFMLHELPNLIIEHIPSKVFHFLAKFSTEGHLKTSDTSAWQNKKRRGKGALFNKQ